MEHKIIQVIDEYTIEARAYAHGVSGKALVCVEIFKNNTWLKTKERFSQEDDTITYSDDYLTIVAKREFETLAAKS